MKAKQFNCRIAGIAVMLCLFVSLQVSAQKKVACVGNSITYGYDFPSPSTQSYPGQMQVLLGSGWTVGNFGSSGRTMLKNSGYSYWDDRKYRAALTSKPNFVVIELGTNDAKNWLWDSQGAQFKNDYKAMVQSFQKLSTKPEIWAGLLIPGNNLEWGILNSYIKDKVNPQIKEVALEMGLNLIDLYTELDQNKPAWYLADSIHPNVTGAGVIAQKVKEMLVMPKPVAVFAGGKVIAPAAYGYQWYFNGGPVASPAGNQQEMAVTQSGNYKVSVKINASTETWLVSPELNAAPSGMAMAAPMNKTLIYPGPVTDFVYLKSDSLKRNTSYKISDLSGRVVLSGNLSKLNDVGSIDVSSLVPGIYVMLLGNERIRFIKEIKN